MAKHLLFYLTIFTLFIITLSLAGTVHVPADTSSIQGGIYLAQPGDTVLVAEGTYYENINFRGKAITVASRYIVDKDTNYINNTIIDGSQPSHPDSGSVVRFILGEDTTSIICGFTITGGSGTKVYIPPISTSNFNGGGILAYESGAKIISNKIIQNHVNSNHTGGGGGISAQIFQTPKFVVIRENKITLNTVDGNMPMGGGVFVADDKINYVIENNRIINNVVNCPSAWKAMGGGIACNHFLPAAGTSGTMIIRNNLISRNELHGMSSFGGGIYLVYYETVPPTVHDPNPLIYNNIITDNYSSKKGGGITVWRFQKNGLVPSPGTGIVAQPVIINNTIVNNRAFDGAGMNIMNAVPLLMNNIIWNELILPIGEEIHIKNIASPVGAWYNLYGGMITSYTNIQDTIWQGTGNISVDPMVFDSLMAPNDTMYCCLSPNSPCIDAGDPDPAYNDIEDPMNLGYGVFPALGTLRNDMGAHGGHGKFGNIIVGIDHKPKRQIVSKYFLSQNYPNPFNPRTAIEIDLPKTSDVTLKIFNILGEEVKTLVSDRLTAGNYKYEWDSSNMASGIYLYRLEAGDFVETRKMVLMR